MFETKSKTAYVLSAIIALLAAAASVGGIAIRDLYRDNHLVTSAFYGNDLVTLLAAVPLLIGSLIFSLRSSLRAQLVWMGMLVYMAYNFAFYLFGAAFNHLFLIYVALFATSVYTIIILLRVLDTIRIGGLFQAGPAIKWISGYMLLIGLFLGGFHVALSLSYVFTGEVPELIETVDHPTNLIAALDLSLVVPLHILGALWLWQRRPWGFLLATIINVQGAVYNLALALGVVTAIQAEATNDPSQIALWGGIAIFSLVISVLLLARLKTQKARPFIHHSRAPEVEAEAA